MSLISAATAESSLGGDRYPKGKTDSKDNVETVIVISVWVSSSQPSKTGGLGSEVG
jgi:hypothetical protein